MKSSAWLCIINLLRGFLFLAVLATYVKVPTAPDIVWLSIAIFGIAYYWDLEHRDHHWPTHQAYVVDCTAGRRLFPCAFPKEGVMVTVKGKLS